MLGMFALGDVLFPNDSPPDSLGIFFVGELRGGKEHTLW